jgi:hypothetical protein
VGEAKALESVGASCGAVSGLKSGACGEESEAARVAEDAAASRGCSNVARPCSNGCSKGAGDGGDAVQIVEEAIVELDAGRIDAARASLKAFVAATRRVRGA